MKEALTLALEALKVSRDMVVDQKYAPLGWSVTRFDEVLTTGKEALTQPEQKPVAWEQFHEHLVEANFCPRCGKRLASGFVEISIHKCTPPKDAR
jgi:hypothetical protein